MSTPTAFEQEMLELINRARANPQGEFDALISDAAVGTAITSNITQALAFFNVDLDLFKQQLAGLPAAAPLAWNNNLAQAAETHTNLMIEEDEQSHRLPGEASLGDRVRDAGYNFNRLAENIFAYTTDPVYGHAGFYIDWGFGPGGIQDPAGHRNAILSASYKEIGIAAVAEANPNTQVGPYVVTQNFGSRSGYEAQLVGVAIEDFDGDVFYDAGEGLSGVTVTATGNGGTFTTTTWGSGGFQMVLPSGTYTVTFTGGGMNTTVTSTVTIGSQNVKLDAITPTNDSDRFDGKAGNDILDLLGGNDIFAAGEGNDSVAGGGGRDTLLGGNREDSLSGGADNDLLRGGAGFDRLMGDGGNDTLYGGGQA
ncbi:MAG: CAP domain-containing protein, partial [Pseudomonadota bacterium]